MKKCSAGELTKQHLVNAAGELAASLGFDNVSTRAVAEASGENIGSIHYHFGGKDGLFLAVVRASMECGKVGLDEQMLEALGSAPSQAQCSAAIRQFVSVEIDSMFRSDRPNWHSQVIYQLLQRDDAYSELFRKDVLDPGLDLLVRLFKVIAPQLTEQQLYLQIMCLKMPIIAHANYQKVLLLRLGATEYAPDYLQELEDLLVRQAQLSLGLPLDVNQNGEHHDVK